MSAKFIYKTQANLSHKFFTASHQEEMLSEFTKVVENPAFGFLTLTDTSNHLDKIDELVSKFKHKKHFVQIGIGGSALGPQMLLSALGDFSTHSFTLLDNIDSDFIEQQLAKIDVTHAVFYVVSKSGGTAETIAITSIVRNILILRKVPESEFKNYFVFCTDPENGQLRKYVNENNFTSLEVPPNIGGRFSVLTNVGMFPAAFFKIDIRQIYAGAQKIKTNILSTQLEDNDLLKTAAHISERYLENGVNKTVLMPYSSLLKDFSSWFVQLWAESLGKINSDGTPVGLTPVPAYGATDQHSQMQLFMEGPSDKVLFLLNIKDRKNDFSLNSGLELESAKKLENFSLNQLMQAEVSGSIKALEENKKDLIVIEVERLDESTLGELILFFKSLTVIMGTYLKVDPFNQPGVEKGKKYAYQYLDSL